METLLHLSMLLSGLVLSGWDLKIDFFFISSKNAIMQHLSLVGLAVKVALKVLDTFLKAILSSVALIVSW